MFKSMLKWLLSLVCVFYTIAPMAFAVDLLDQAIEPSKQNNQVLDLGNNRNAVGNSVFRASYDPITGERQEPMIARITKTILRATLVLWVTMWLLIWVRYIFAQWDEATEKKLMWYIRNIVYGILIALAALAIVELILSITKSTVTI